NASTPLAKKDGANVLLAWEGIRRSREAGARWLNWGGATRFKLEFGGERVEISCRLGGGPAWLVPNLVDASTHRTRSRVGSWWRAHAKSRLRRGARPAAPAKHAEPEGALACWRTAQKIEPEFERAWKDALSGAPFSNF